MVFSRVAGLFVRLRMLDYRAPYGAASQRARTSSSPAPRLFAVYPAFLDPASKIGCLVNGIAIRSRLAGIADNFDFDAGLDQPV